MITYIILVALYSAGLIWCYNKAAQDEHFVEEFKKLPTTGAWAVFAVVLFAWPLCIIWAIVSKIKEK